MKLKGKTALITGAGTGVGQGIAIELARQGANVAINYNVSRTGAESTYSQIKEFGGNAIIIQADIADKANIDEMTKQTYDKFGSLDILVNNSALQKNSWLAEYTQQDLELLISVNLRGYFLCIQSSLQYMKKSEYGRIINISSIHGKYNTNFDAAYSFTKGGIKMLTREAAIEFIPYNITVNSLELGGIQISGKSGNPRPFRGYPFDYKHPNSYVSSSIGAGHPTEVGKLAAFIASEESRYINGSGIRIDGGRVLV